MIIVNSKQFPIGTKIKDILKELSIKDVVLVEKDGALLDITADITEGGELTMISSKDPKALETLRHDAAHILAQALTELCPDVKLAIGPVIEDGFYYDFESARVFTEEDFNEIEKKMKEIVARKLQITKEIWPREKALDYFKADKEIYKYEIFSNIEAESITIYKQGDFLDPCRGPHFPHTGYLKHFKLTKIAGAYFKGDSNRPMLQRIYGTAWLTKESLNEYLFFIEEAKKRDHRKLGKELELFHLQEEAQGMVFWHPKGWAIYRALQEYIRRKLNKNGYQEVNTPIIVNKELWEKSGHYETFKENMFFFKEEGKKEKILAVKPMNCPCHLQIFNQSIKSYKDLPIRMAEFGSCHRNEPSGSLHGLMRVRGFTQDDAHIFCTEGQITGETIKFCNLLSEVYKDFGFTDVLVKFSDRPSVRAGSDEVWDKAEGALLDAIKSTNLTYCLNPGEGAFYGPKLEFVLIDALKRHWQCGTLQVDFIMPQRLDANYIDSQGNKQRPVMLHRAILGSFERFIGILIEQYAGKFPIWLCPVQVVVLTIVNEVDEYACAVYKKLLDASVRVEKDLSPSKIGYKIRYWSSQKTPIIVVLGNAEKSNGTINVRGMEDITDIDKLIDHIKINQK